MATEKNRPIGSKAKRNGKDVIWAGQDYGFQSPASFKKLEQEGELSLGAGLVRRVKQVGNQIEQKRHETFGTVSDDNPVVRAVNSVENLTSKLPGARAAEGASMLGQRGAKALGLSPVIGGMLLGSVVPGGGGSGAKWGTNRPLSRATRQRQRRMIDGTPSPKLQQLAEQELPRQQRAQRHGTRQGDSRPLNESAKQPPPQGDTARRLSRQGSEVTSRAINDRPTQVQQQAVERFFSGDKTAQTFSSKKGSNNVTNAQIDDIVDSLFEGQGDYNSQGYYTFQGDKNPGRRGRSGQVQVLANSIQRQRELAGKKPLGKSQLAETVKKRLRNYQENGLSPNPRTDAPPKQSTDPRNPPKPDARRQRSNLRQRPVVNEVPPTRGPDTRRPRTRVLPNQESTGPQGVTDPQVVRGDRARGQRQVGKRPQGQIPSRPGDGGTRPANLKNPPRNRKKIKPELPTLDGFTPGGEVRGLSTRGPKTRRGKSQQAGGVFMTDEQFRQLRERRRNRRNK